MSLNYALQALYHFTGDVTDASGNGNDGTNNGVTFVTDKLGNSNSAGLFNDADADRVDTNYRVPSGQDKITISAWVNPDNVQSFGTILNNRDDSGTRGIALLRNDSGGDYFFDVNTTNGRLQAYSGVTVNGSGWTMVTGVYDGSEIRIYIDGVLKETTSHSGDLITPNEDIFVGARANGGNPWNGKIDEVRFYTRALTQYEISQLFYAYDTDKNQVGILNEDLVYASHFNSGNADDWSGNGNNGTVNGATATTDKNGTADSALSFDRTQGDFVEADFLTSTFEDGDWTFITWIFPTDLSSENNRKYVLDCNENDLIIFSAGDNTNTTHIGFYDGTGWNGLDAGLTINTWFQIAFVKRGSTVEGYADGKYLGDFTTSYTNGTHGGMSFGARSDTPNTSDSYDGKIDEPRFYSRALNPVEVLMLYKGYDSEQNSQDTFDMDLVAYYPFTGDYTDASGNGNDGTNNGTTLTTDKNGVNNQAIEYDATGDKVTVDDSSGIFDQTPFSVLSWFKFDTSGRNVIAGKWDESINNRSFSFVQDSATSDKIRVLTSADGSNLNVNFTSNNAPSFNMWHSAVVSDDSNNIQIYLNGSFETSSTSSSLHQSTIDFEIGHFPQYGGDEVTADGTIDEIRYYSRAVTQDEVIEYTYSYDSPTMLDDDLVGGGVVNVDALFFSGGF